MTDVLIFKALILGGVAFVMVTLVLYALASHLGRDLARHDLIRGARLKREEYIREMERRRIGDPDLQLAGLHDQDDSQYNVDIVDDEPPLRQAA